MGEVQYFSKTDQYVNMVDEVIQGTSTRSFIVPDKFYKSKLNLLQNICVIKGKKILLFIWIAVNILMHKGKLAVVYSSQL